MPYYNKAILIKLLFALLCFICVFDPIRAAKLRNGGRTCIQTNGIQVCTSARCAGAIDYVAWNGKQFISDYDHGRELQIAVTVDDWQERFNPTEAGSVADGASQQTSSK